MASINSVSGRSTAFATGAEGAASAQTPSRTPQKVLGQSDFLKLLATQFQKQDPMKPMEDTAFIAQMAQFSALEQSSSLVQHVTQLRNQQDIATANGYIGRKVTLDLGKGGSVSGNVTAVDVSTGAPRLVIGDNKYPLSAVLLVEPGVPPAPSQPAQPGGA